VIRIDSTKIRANRNNICWINCLICNLYVIFIWRIFSPLIFHQGTKQNEMTPHFFNGFRWEPKQLLSWDRSELNYSPDKHILNKRVNWTNWQHTSWFRSISTIVYISSPHLHSCTSASNSANTLTSAAYNGSIDVVYSKRQFHSTWFQLAIV
jgi:hypothetical protein